MKYRRDYPKRSERTTLKRLSDTRWTCRIDSLRAIRKCFSAVIDALTSVAEHNDRERSIEAAAGLLSRVQTLDFVSSLVFENLLSITKGLSDQLQAQDLDLVGALDLLQVTVDQLVEARERMWQDILQLAQQNCVRVQIPGASSRGRVRKQKEISDFVLMETTGQRLSDFPTDSGDRAGDYFRRSLFMPALDQILQEMDSRFSDELVIV